MSLIRMLRWALILRALKKLRIERERQEALEARRAEVLYKRPSLDSRARRLAERTGVDYGYAKHVLDSFSGDEPRAEEFIDRYAAKEGAA